LQFASWAWRLSAAIAEDPGHSVHVGHFRDQHLVARFLRQQDVAQGYGTSAGRAAAVDRDAYVAAKVDGELQDRLHGAGTLSPAAITSPLIDNPAALQTFLEQHVRSRQPVQRRASSLIDAMAR
jgi:hypothetical protein